MSKINTPNVIRYLYPCTVESVGLGTVTAGGRVLRTIGNVQVRPGDRIWTDGRVAYGHTPPREQVNPATTFSGVPFIGLPWGADNWYQGYYTDRAIRKPKHIGPISTSSFLVNNGRSLFLEKPAAGRAVVDVEMLSDDKGTPIGYSIATVREGEQICSANNSEILIENSLGTRSEVIAIKNNIFVNAAINDFMGLTGVRDYNFGGLFSSQYLYFRFTDEKGNWELLVGVSVRGLRICHTDLPQSAGRPLFHTYSTLSRSIISREPFIGGTDIVSCAETVTITSEQTGRDEPSGSTEYWENVEQLFAAVKLDSSGRVTVAHRNYHKDVGVYYATTGWDEKVTSHDASEDASIFIGPGSAGPVGVPFDESFNSWFDKSGSYSYNVRYAAVSGEDIIGAPQVGFAEGLSGVTTTTSYNAVSQTIRFPSIFVLNDLSTALPDGFSATLEARNSTYYGALSITQGSNRVIDDYGYRGNCWLDSRYGLVHGGAELSYWFFPHISCYKFPNSPKTLAAEFGYRLLMCQDGQYDYLDTQVANTRLRRMRRIVRTPVLRPGQNTNNSN